MFKPALWREFDAFCRTYVPLVGSMNSVDWSGPLEWITRLLEWITGLEYWTEMTGSQF